MTRRYLDQDNPAGNACAQRPAHGRLRSSPARGPERRFGGSQLDLHLSGLPACRPGERVNQALLGRSIVALLATKLGLAMSEDEEISGPGARRFGLASQVEWESNLAILVASPRIPGRLGVMNNFPSCFRRGPALHQMVQGQGVVNARIVDHRWGCSLASRLRGSTPAWPKSCALGITAAGPSRPTSNGFAASSSIIHSRRSP
jgi:hypothetical protein